jgi:Spy/CpxP family protein refolding chaperone
MKRLAILTLAALAATTPLAEQAWAGPGRHAGPGHHQKSQDRLGLTEEQAKAIRDIHASKRDATHELWRQAAATQSEIRQLALAGADDTALQAKLAEFKEIQGKMLKLRIDTLREVAPLLTEEQKQKFGKMPFDHGRGHRRGPRPPAEG